MSNSLRIIGRTSSHFTRTARIFAEELGLSYELKLVPDLISRDPEDYGGNPALRLPILEMGKGNLYGTLNICRELARRAETKRRIVWPEDLSDPLLANAQELITQAMATEVTLIVSRLGGVDPGSVHAAKLKDSLANSLSWLETRIPEILRALPQRDLSFLEVTLFCLLTHLEFRQIVPTEPYQALSTFCEEFASRPSAANTPYVFQT